MHKKPFYSDRSDKKVPGNKDGRFPGKSSDAGSDKKDYKGAKPFGKPGAKNDDKPSFRKPLDKSDKQGFNRNRKQFGQDGPEEQRAFRKPFDKSDKAGFNKNRKDYHQEGSDDKRSFRKPFEKDRPSFKKTDKDRGDRDTRKSYGKQEDRPFRKRDDKDFEGKRFDKGAGKFAGKDRKTEHTEQKVDRYAHTFGKLSDEELIAHKKKQLEKKAEQESAPEITFSKEVEDKWTEEPVARNFGKSDVNLSKRKSVEGTETEGKKRHRHDASSRFKKQFDDENPHEKAYSARAEAGMKKQQDADENDGEKPMPLNKYIAHCDVCSRRDAVQLIKEGKVTVNGVLVNEPGFKVTLEDEVNLNGKRLVVQKNLIYILMNKPKGFITTTDDPKGRRTVMELVENFVEERVFPVGRLDRNTTGLLLLTNDGELTQKLSHPKYDIKKVYKATLDKNLSKDDFEKIKAGVILEDGPAPVDQLEYLDSKNEIGLEIHSGKNRIVRRIFESLGYEVVKLDRVMYAGLTKKNVLRGKWRFLTKQEVINLKHMH
jgi:23S rRNA pseudouridine2605 synthase